MPVVLITALIHGGVTVAAPRPIDTANSAIIVRVYKAGVFSPFGHDHEIAAPIANGAVDTTARTVELHVNTVALKVRDEHVSDKDRGEIQTTMLGPDDLDSEHQAEIVFRSKSAEPSGGNVRILHGDLSLHGQTHPVEGTYERQAAIIVGKQDSRKQNLASGRSRSREAPYG